MPSYNTTKKIEDCGKDTKKLYKVANDLLHRKQKSPLPEYLTHGDQAELANCFNQHFVDKILAVRQCFQTPVLPSNDTVGEIQSELCEFQPVTVSEMEAFIKNSPNKSCELDPIPTDLVKKCTTVLVPVITRIINASLSSGVVPQVCKKAVIHPTLKKSGLDQEILKNYRPISNLSFLGKLLERVVFSQLTAYLQENELFDPCQSAYRPGHSVETLLVNLTDSIFREMDNGNITALIMLDMSSAFDTVDHTILIQRLNSLGIKGTALDWFISYLSERSQYVRIGSSTSGLTTMKFGVPQGSVGGPLLFSLYMQPISMIFHKHRISYHCYADDIQLYLSFQPTMSSLTSAITKLETCLQDLKTWLVSNGLKLNDDTTEFFFTWIKVYAKKN